MRLLILAAILVTELGAQQTVVRFGKLIDGTGKVIPDAAVVIERDRIVRVESGAAIPPNAKVIDLRRYTGLPGLIDAHTHMRSEERRVGKEGRSRETRACGKKQ